MEIKDLINELQQLEDMRKEYNELLEYKRKYLEIVKIVERNEGVPTKIELTPKIERKVIKLNGRKPGEVLRELRKQRHLKNKEVAKKAGIAPSTLWVIEQEKGNYTQSSLNKLKDFYKIEIEE